MRSYDQYCSLAKALDVVGDRWTLLVVRELMTQGPCRYSDLRRGLPGIATNLLATRLSDMTEAGLVVREELPAPANAQVFALTPRGRGLLGVMRELTAWGAAELESYAASDQFRVHWLALPARYFLGDGDPSAGRAVVRIGTAPDALDVTVDAGTVDIAMADPRVTPAATFDGPPPVLVGTITGRMPLTTARKAGLQVTGDVAAVRRILPSASPPT